jgi:hypothetical protein
MQDIQIVYEENAEEPKGKEDLERCKKEKRLTFLVFLQCKMPLSVFPETVHLLAAVDSASLLCSCCR